MIQMLALCLTLLILISGCVSDFPQSSVKPETSPLILAVTEGDVASVHLLLEKGMDPNAVSRTGVKALSVAAENGQSEIILALLDKGADIHARNDDGSTALIRAARWGHATVVQLLLAKGADQTARDRSGMTALRWAQQVGNVEVVQLLGGELSGGTAPITGQQAFSVMSDVDRVPAVRVSPKKNAYAVVIGIEQYREKLPKAEFADRDAKLVGEYLTKVLGYPEENVIVRTNERAARTDLVKYFEEWLRNNVEKDGSVFVYYSGHGAPNTKTGEAYFVPYDGDPSFVDSTAYPVKQLYAALDKLPAKDITVVLDSCFSGSGGRSVLAKGARPMVLSIENPVLASGKTIVLTASGGDQISNSFEEQGHGLLTYFFLKGLQGEGDVNKDGVIQMTELYDYLKPNVQRVSRKQYNNEQTPQLLASPEVLKRGGGRLLERTRP